MKLTERERWLREMREAKVQPAVTKPQPTVTKPRGGRPSIGERAMTAAERMRRMRARGALVMVRSLELERQGELLRGPGEELRRVPEVTWEMHVHLAAIELAAGRPLCEVRFGNGEGTEWRPDAGVLRRLIREGLIEVMGLGPAVYR